MERFHPEDSGIWGARTARLEPETVVLAVAWVLAIVQICIGVARGGPFGPDRAIAVAFAVLCPLLARSGLRRP
jgi:hypothetical protein